MRMGFPDDFLSKLLFDSPRQFVGIIDPVSSRFVRVNEAGAALFGKPDEAAFLADSIAPSALLADLRLRMAGLEDRNGLVEEIAHWTIGEKSFRALLEVRPFPYDSGTFWLVRITNLDQLQTERRTPERSVRNSDAHSTSQVIPEGELRELQTRFMTMASHEFRTPLSVVLTSSILLEKYTMTEQQEKRDKHIQRIKTSVNHLNDLLDEFLAVGQLEEGRLAVFRSWFDLGELINDLAAYMREVLKPGQRIQVELDHLRPVWLDRRIVRQILLNLISNAIKFSAENKPILIRAWEDEQFVCVSIDDQGVGIPEEEQSYIFNRFFRARNASSVQGTGLGLYLVGKYLELLEGAIECQSQLHRGTTVTIRFRYDNDSAH